MLWREFSFHIRHFPSKDQDAIERAFKLGEKAHAEQTRLSGEAYFTHPIAVAHILIGMGADRDTIIAALLHDTVEDTDVTLEQINNEFGPKVSMLIDGVTKLSEQDVAERPTMNEKIETLRKMFTLMQKDIRIMVIKLADRLHNMQTIAFRKIEKQKMVANETLDIYVKIADRLCMREMRDNLEFICRGILDPDTHKSVTKLRTSNEEKCNEAIALMKKKIKSHKFELPLEIKYESKTWEKLLMQSKMEKESPNYSLLLSMAYICEDIDSCYKMLGIIHQMWPREVLSFDDYINAPIINGYKGLQTTAILESGIRIRCKIRTKEMDEYARRGITTVCFDSEARGIEEYLPWTQRITSLSQETQDRSKEFWDTLQTDILTESIVVYGSGGKSALVPQGSTALDAALYLYSEEAKRLHTIKINGQEVSFSHHVARADTVEIITGKNTEINRDWLYWVQTGRGISMVRSALSSDTHQNLEEIGENLLQQAFRERGRGYFEEVNTTALQQTLHLLGYDTIEDLYLALANKHVTPSDVITTMDQSQGKTTNETGKQDCKFIFSVNRDVESMKQLLGMYEKYNISMQDVRLRISRSNEVRMSIRLKLTSLQQEVYRQDLIAAGAKDITVSYRSRQELLLMGVVVFFWSLNPVWAKYFLSEGMEVTTLISLRSILYCIFSVVFYLGWRSFLKGSTYSRIPKVSLVAFVPAITTFINAVLTYFAISAIPPSVHLTILRFNGLVLPLLMLGKRKFNWAALALGWAVFAASIFAFIDEAQIPVHGILLSLGTLLSYTFYSLSTERTLQENKIGARYPHLHFHIGLFMGLFGLILLPTALNTMDAWLPRMPWISLYVLLCVFVPHTCFHIVLQRARFRHVTSMSLVEVPIGILLEAAMLGIFLAPASYLSMTMILVMFTFLLRIKAIK